MDAVERYAEGICELNRYSQARTLVVDTIVNPSAGFFRRKRTLRKIIMELERRLSSLKQQHPHRRVELHRIHFTQYCGHAKSITERILEDELRRDSGTERLIIGAGGDGTSNEICTTLYAADLTVLERMKLLRFPLGTGNDNADAKTFQQAYALILGRQETERTAALCVETQTQRRFAFNIASVGLDAYVTRLTNFFKRVVPGEAYRLMVNAGTLFYDSRYGNEPVQITLRNAGTEVARVRTALTMISVGVSGNRTYGGGMHILPGQENVCLIKAMGLLKKLGSKQLLFRGEHGSLQETRFYTADELIVDRIASELPVQVDGEDFLLLPGDLPLRVRLLEPRIQVVCR